MREYGLFEIAVSVLALLVLAPVLAIAILPFGLLGAPVFVALILPVVAISASGGT
jgi:hypothetical protein